MVLCRKNYSDLLGRFVVDRVEKCPGRPRVSDLEKANQLARPGVAGKQLRRNDSRNDRKPVNGNELRSHDSVDEKDRVAASAARPDTSARGEAEEAAAAGPARERG